MTEAEKRIREALAAGPTPGPWHHDSDPVKNDPLHRVRFRVTAKGRTITETYYSSAQPGAPFTSGEADNRFIAACNPVNVASLLTEIDRVGQLTRERDEARAERDALRDVLLRHGFVPCDIPACNCGSWHARFGYPERLREIADALDEAGHPLSNENGNMPLNALRELIAERDALARDAARYRRLRRKVCIIGNEFSLLNTAPTYVAPNAAIELDAVTDAQIEKERSEQKEGR